MHLKVGELARSTGLTVRTLHHYDEIGLLKPSGRSDAGYRLYAEADVARLHAIQALRHLGLPLGEIGPLLDGGESAPERIIEQQMHALELQIRQANELRERLTLIRGMLLKGKTPGMDDWVRSLSMMTTFGRYFSARELKQILGAYAGIEAEWLQLQSDVRSYMDAGGAIDTEPCQVLARRWMALVMRWMGGDMDLIDRWGAMFRKEVSARGQGGAPATDMMEFMHAAIELRARLLREHFAPCDFRQARLLPDAQAQAIEEEGQALLREGEPPAGPRAQALRARWMALLDLASQGDPVLRDRLATLHRGHPLLMAGLPLGRAVREYLSAPTPGA